MNQRSSFSLAKWAGKADNSIDLQLNVPRFDVATIIHKGARQYQQDALLANFLSGEDTGIGILADGMGGHHGGDVASAITVSTVFTEIKKQMATKCRSGKDIGPMLHRAADMANNAVSAEVTTTPALQGMGSTLLACVNFGPQLYWVSVGDSPLYLHRDGAIKRLNEDHSMAPQIDAMAASGLLSEDLAKDHPQRNQLTSAICGDDLSRVDCPADPFAMKVGDVLILASDGLQTLSDEAINNIITRKKRRSSEEIAQALMQGVLDIADDQQDNISILVVKVMRDAQIPDRAKDSESDLLFENKDQDGKSIEKASDLLNQALRL